MIRRTSKSRAADGRELIYYDARDDAVRDAVDPRPLDPIATSSEIRHDR
ncbi:galactose-1-phosphate uridylyltransferase, partial [Streptomyces sp. MCAF7]